MIVPIVTDGGRRGAPSVLPGYVGGHGLGVPLRSGNSSLRSRRTNRNQRRYSLLRDFPWWILLELTLVALVTWGLSTAIRMLANPMTLPVTAVRVVGPLAHLEPAAIEQAVTPAATGGFLQVDVHNVRQAATTLPWVADAQVRRLWPGTLRITITEQEPEARWTPQDQPMGLVNKQGKVFYPDVATFPQDLPEVGGPEGSALDMLNHLNQLNRLFAPLGLKVHSLQLDPRRAWTVGLSNGIRLLLGRTDLDNRLERFLRIYPSALAAQAERILRIDLRYSNGFAVGWKTPT